MRYILLSLMILSACSTTKLVTVMPLDRFDQKEVLAAVETLSASNSFEDIADCALASRAFHSAFQGGNVDTPAFNEKVRRAANAELWRRSMFHVAPETTGYEGYSSEFRDGLKNNRVSNEDFFEKQKICEVKVTSLPFGFVQNLENLDDVVYLDANSVKKPAHPRIVEVAKKFSDVPDSEIRYCFRWAENNKLAPDLLDHMLDSDEVELQTARHELASDVWGEVYRQRHGSQEGLRPSVGETLGSVFSLKDTEWRVNDRTYLRCIDPVVKARANLSTETSSTKVSS